MGLASSQARIMMLVARKSDIEYRGQTINQRRLVLSFHTEELAKNYSTAMSNRRLNLITSTEANGTSNKERLSVEGLLTHYDIQVRDTNDNPVAPGTVDEDALEVGLRSGTYYLYGMKMVDGGYEEGIIDWRTLPLVDDQLNDEDDESASAKYEYESAIIHSEDRRLEVELKNLDTQHKAIETEIEAVKKVIDKNIEMSFKTFA